MLRIICTKSQSNLAYHKFELLRHTRRSDLEVTMPVDPVPPKLHFYLKETISIVCKRGIIAVYTAIL